MRTTTLTCITALLCGLPLAAQADAQLAGVFGDHMVLQRDAPIRVWGQASPGEAVQVQFKGSTRRTVAAQDGRWVLQLPASKAGGPYTLRVQARNAITLSDVMVGEVWVCAGQSNMEFELKDAHNATQALAQADQPLIRHFKIDHRASVAPLDDLPASGWQVASPKTAGQFSAVGYFFAQRLQQDPALRHMAIGLVNVSWGGSHIETWLSPKASLADPTLAPLVRDFPKDNAAFAAAYQARAWALVKRWQHGVDTPEPDATAWAQPSVDDSTWPTLLAPQIWEEQGLPGFDGVVWMRRQVQLTAAQTQGPAILHLGTVDDCDETFVNGQKVGGFCGWDTPRHHAVPTGLLHKGNNLITVRVTDTGGGGGFYGEAGAMRLETPAGSLPLAGPWRARVGQAMVKAAPSANDAPTLAYNGMLKPLLPLRVQGVLWYQGESNVPRAARYAQDLRTMIADWRSAWGAVPFYGVQLASFLPLNKNDLQASPWAELREAQRQALHDAGNGMAVATDVGDANDIHPRNKQALGERLARWALRDVHHQRITVEGPVWLSQQPQGGQITLRFAKSASALAVRGGGNTLAGFAIAGADQHFVPAQATIAGQRIVVSSPQVPHPVAVRYGWVNNPEQANLVNTEGLPASPFRTDAWPLQTQGVNFAP
jgi:sialate O-acetylesterase